MTGGTSDAAKGWWVGATLLLRKAAE